MAALVSNLVLVLVTLLPFFYSWVNNWKDNLAQGLLLENSEEKDAHNNNQWKS